MSDANRHRVAIRRIAARECMRISQTQTRIEIRLRGARVEISNDAANQRDSPVAGHPVILVQGSAAGDSVGNHIKAEDVAGAASYRPRSTDRGLFYL